MPPSRTSVSITRTFAAGKMGAAQEVVIRLSRVPGRWLRCPRCAERGAAWQRDHSGWGWRCRTCHHTRESARRRRLHDDLTAFINTGHSLRARCFTNEDLHDLTADVTRWIQRQDALLRKRLGKTWVRDVQASGGLKAAESSHGARSHAEATLGASVAARLTALERILSDHCARDASSGQHPR
jgi:hypothetical protein